MMSPGLMSPNPYNSDLDSEKGFPRFRTLSQSSLDFETHHGALQSSPGFQHIQPRFLRGSSIRGGDSIADDQNPSLYITQRDAEVADSEAGSDKLRKNALLNLLKDFGPA